jgi:hypothetical protein
LLLLLLLGCSGRGVEQGCGDGGGDGQGCGGAVGVALSKSSPVVAMVLVTWARQTTSRWRAAA